MLLLSHGRGWGYIVLLGCERGPGACMGGLGGARRQYLGVKLYWDKIYGMLVQEKENISGSRARSVATTTSIEIETSDAATV